MANWSVEFHNDFESEFEELEPDVQDALLARMKVLQIEGPQLPRPYADTLNGSGFSNMKELRFDQGDGVWRFAYAFDPQRKAIILVGGDKTGMKPNRFYGPLIKIADERFRGHLDKLKGKDNG